MKTFAIGDIHGAHKAMMQCFARSKFNYEKDRLIVMGDVCDGYPEVRQCIDELLKIKHCDLVIGNHDMWTLDWALRGDNPEIWTSQGGDRTMASYNGGPMPQEHIDFLKGGQLWLERENQVFVHGGFNPDISLSAHSAQALVWDRSLLDMAWKKQMNGHKCQLGKYKDIFVGHTTTELYPVRKDSRIYNRALPNGTIVNNLSSEFSNGVYNTLQPIHVCNVWNIDTGAGWSGKLTIMDVDSKKYWQSDLSPGIYGGTPDKLTRAQ